MTHLQRKLNMNAERRAWEQMLPAFPDEIQTLLQDAQLRFSEDLFSALKESPFPNFEGGILVTKDWFDLYWHLEVDQIQHIYRMLSESNICMKAPVAIHLGKGPVYLVERHIGTEEITLLASCLSDLSVSHIFVVDKSQGVILDSYCGYLPDGRSTTQEEVVYEFTYYQDLAQDVVMETLICASDLFS